MLGPGPVKIQLPPGSRTYQMKPGMSGHWMLPTSNFAGAQKAKMEGQFDVQKSLELPSDNLVLQTEVALTGAASSQSVE